MQFERAVELHRAGRVAEAETLCREILAAEADHPRALRLLSAIRFAAGDKATAIDLVRRAVASKPDYAEAQFNLAAMLVGCARSGSRSLP